MRRLYVSQGLTSRDARARLRIRRERRSDSVTTPVAQANSGRLLENERPIDGAPLKWFKPGERQFQIHVSHESPLYEPDFVVETNTTKYLCEPKRADQMLRLQNADRIDVRPVAA